MERDAQIGMAGERRHTADTQSVGSYLQTEFVTSRKRLKSNPLRRGGRKRVVKIERTVLG